MQPSIILILLISGAMALDIPIKNPPLEQADGDWVLIPRRDGSLYKVHRESAMNEEYPEISVEFAVHFELYTLKNPEKPQLIKMADIETLHESNFNSTLPTRIVTHGWNSQGTLTPLFTEAYFKKGNRDVNLIIVDWRKGADTINYIAARKRIAKVGAYVAHFIDFLVKKANMNLRDLTLIGHSLGAHVSGIAGKNVTTGKVSKIVGLDPAYPLFTYEEIDGRLANTDAEYVEVIHTSAGFLGFAKPLGHTSFYPNGGRSHPGCGIDMYGGCAHARSYKFFAESIHSGVDFYSFHCRSFEDVKKGNCHVIDGMMTMGGDPGNQKGAKGIYYLETNKVPIFAIGEPIVPERDPVIHN